MPVAHARITSRYGMRTAPIDGDLRKHSGLDLAAPRGTPITAARSGVVSIAGERSGFGRVVILDHGGGLQTVYAHCDRLDVQVGETVAAGQPIATVGSTGRSTGPHLHFEVRSGGSTEDPAAWLGLSRQSAQHSEELVR